MISNALEYIYILSLDFSLCASVGTNVLPVSTVHEVAKLQVLPVLPTCWKR